MRHFQVHLEKPVADILALHPFNSWKYKRSVIRDVPGKPVYYEFRKNGISLGCDKNEILKSIFVELSEADPDVINLTRTLNRADVLAEHGEPTRSGSPSTSEWLGRSGAWDRYDKGGFSLHFQYELESDQVEKITIFSDVL